MEGKKRKRLGALAWKELVQRHEGSGLTVGAFCEREGLSKSTLLRWRAQLRSEGAMADADDQAQGSQPGRGLHRASEFVDLGAIGGPGTTPSRVELRLELGAGVTLHVVRG